ncbi:hypothetical protein SESBI_32404 [Sesbania bispinosa]|nr:hypothetical protein SESBI_32404 [Sesbania bispinosa]
MDKKSTKKINVNSDTTVLPDDSQQHSDAKDTTSLSYKESLMQQTGMPKEPLLEVDDIIFPHEESEEERDLIQEEHLPFIDLCPRNDYDESADDSSLLHHTTPQNPYGPWMLVKRPPRRRLSGNQDKEREKGAKATGSRFNILEMVDEPTETVETEITAPVQIPKQKMTRIRDPTVGKNSQQHKKELHRKLLLLFLRRKAKNQSFPLYLTSFLNEKIGLF